MEKNIEIIQNAMKALDLTCKKSSDSLLTNDKSKTFSDEPKDGCLTTVGTFKIKHVRRESAYIQQKILDLQTCAQKSDKEIYGAGLLEAIMEFENFVAKNWGRNHSSRKRQNIMLLFPENNKNLSIQQTSSMSTSVLKSSKGNLFVDFCEKNQPNCPLQSVHSSSSEISDYDVCKLCQRTCPCKSQSVVELFDDKSAIKSTLESSSKAVNTDIDYIRQHINTATNTTSAAEEVQSILEPSFKERSEQLSKLTIRLQNPITQQPDFGGGENSSVSMMTKNEDMKFANSETNLNTANSSESTLLEDDIFSRQDDESCPIYPSEDMKVALKLVNDALLHGRTGKEIAASVSVILNEWFLRVGSKTVRASDISNYLNTFQSYSPQLLRYLVNIPNMSGITALHFAVSYGNYPVVSKLLETKMTDPNKANKAGYTSIMLASIDSIKSISQEQAIRKLISLGDVNIKAAQHGQTALMLAASNGNFRMVKLLLEAGADVNAQDEDGSTALMCAVEHGHADIVQCLLACPACDPSLTDNDGLTALNVAMEADQKDVAVLLYAHMHFGKNASSSGTSSSDNQLLLLKKSKSTANISSFISDHTRNYDRKSDSHFVSRTRKQTSSIN